MIPDGVDAQFQVQVSAAGTRYTASGTRSSVDGLSAALQAAATYRSSNAGLTLAIVVAAIVGLMIEPWLLLLVAVAAVALFVRSNNVARARSRVTVAYSTDPSVGLAYDSLTNGVHWLSRSNAVWRVTGEEKGRVERWPAGVSVGTAPKLVTNIVVPSIAAGWETLLFLPDTLLVRGSQVSAVPYESLQVELETTHFTEPDSVPRDAKPVGNVWLYANKDGGPDRRRANNRQLPVLEYSRVVMSWRGSAWVVLVSSADSARHFTNGLRAMVRLRNPAEEKPMTTTIQPRMPAPPTELELALQASIDRKRRLEELEQAAAAERARRQPLQPEASWIAEGGSANVLGYTVGPFIYVGARLPQLSGYDVEPSLINPALPVDPAHANATGMGMNYWPSYGGISAASRAAYLQWLAGGRKTPDAYIGYVFIYFYGLERRVYEFVQGKGSTSDEVLAIAREVARLLDVYGSASNSFEAYGSALLDFIGAIEMRARGLRREEVRPGYGVPLRLRMVLGELAAAEKPVPATLALDWVRATQFLNTPATRCRDEFELLFHIRYAKQFGDGMLIKPNKTAVDLTYRPASGGLDALTLKRPGVPDVAQLSRPLAKLVELAQECSGALDAFSRFLGKNEAGRESLAAFALLPEELVEATHSADAKALAGLVQSRLDEDGRAHLAAGELLQYVRLSKPDKVSKSEGMLLAQALEKLGYGIEPDPRLGGPAYDVDGKVVVFRRLPDCPSAASDDYAAAMLLVRLGAMVSAADDAVSQAERELLERHIEERLRLTPGERQRLAAHLAWILEADLGMTGLKKRLEGLPKQTRGAIAKLLVEVAATDGHVDAREMKILEKLYTLLDLPAADLYRDVHIAHAVDDEPVVVAEPADTAKGFAIPPPAATTAAGLDMSRVRLTIAETREVSALLSSIFVEEEAPAPGPPVPQQAGTIGTLDAAHSELLRRLAERESWPREEVEQLAAGLSLMTDGALETINDYAYATADEPFWEDDDPLAINSKVAMELIR